MIAALAFTISIVAGVVLGLFFEPKIEREQLNRFKDRLLNRLNMNG